MVSNCLNMVEKLVILFPKTFLATRDTTVELLGFVTLVKNVWYYFILPNCVNNTNTEYNVRTIGHFKRTDCQSCLEQKVTNDLCITEINGNLNINSLPGHFDSRVLIIYDPSTLYDYETFPDREADSKKFFCFTILSKWLSSTKNDVPKHHREPVVQGFTKYLLIILNVLIITFETKFIQLTILRLTFFEHIFSVIKNYVWLTEHLMHNKQSLSKAKALNYLTSCICDAFLGITVLYILNTTFASSIDLFSLISNISQVYKPDIFIRIYYIIFNIHNFISSM